jgi:hypothetical protein
MLYGGQIIIDHPLFHRSLIRIGLPYTGPLFLWCVGANCWTWDLEFLEIGTPVLGKPDSVSVWGIHQRQPHPPERASTWLPRTVCLLDPQVTNPNQSSVAHGFHADNLQVSVDPAGVDLATGQPIYAIDIRLIHLIAAPGPDGVPPRLPRPTPCYCLWDRVRAALNGRTILSSETPPAWGQGDDTLSAPRRGDGAEP